MTEIQEIEANQIGVFCKYLNTFHKKGEREEFLIPVNTSTGSHLNNSIAIVVRNKVL